MSPKNWKSHYRKILSELKGRPRGPQVEQERRFCSIYKAWDIAHQKGLRRRSLLLGRQWDRLEDILGARRTDELLLWVNKPRKEK